MANPSVPGETPATDPAPASVVSRFLVDGVARERLIAALLDAREFPDGHVGEKRYRDETNAVVRRNIETVFSEAGLAKLLADLPAKEAE